MKVELVQDEQLNDIYVLVRYPQKTKTLQRLVTNLRSDAQRLSGMDGQKLCVVPTAQVLYIESVDKRCFAYTDTSVLRLGMPLYEAKARLETCDFVRIARACLVNFNRIASIEPEFNGRLIITLDNAEKLIVSRQYAGIIRKKLDM